MTKLTYSSSGVDIDSADLAKQKIAELAKSTFDENVLTRIGLFAGAYDIGHNEVLLASSDGVGTKILVAIRAGIYNTVGIDIVHHCANDIAVHNADPMFILDYIGHSDLTPQKIAEIVEGLSNGCNNVNCALIGGETAQMPGFYPPNIFDLTATIIGRVAKDKMITGEKITSGDAIIALPANGLHTNGYSLARKVLFDIAKFDDVRPLQVDTYIDDLGETIGEALLRVHPNYSSAVKILRDNVNIHGMAHITGGGVCGNLVRVIPKNVKAIVRKNTAPKIPIFELIKKLGNIADDEMFKAFNMGFGYLIIVPSEQADSAIESLSGFSAFIAGEIVGGVTTANGERKVEII
ncbi:phosphoribosylformylglycinamidine cyclo-ligase [bacterium]|nr:phosphoribosylformylglycinamidine cyclo-ligase [bacterium]